LAHGVPGRIHVSKVTADCLGGKFALEPRGVIEIKGAGSGNVFPGREGARVIFAPENTLPG